MERSCEGVGAARERALFDGVSQLSDVELLVLVLGAHPRGRPAERTAAELLEGGNLASIARASPALLASVGGVGPQRAVRVAAAFELGRRAARTAAEPRRKMTTAAEVAELARERLGHLDHEEMWVLALDGQNGARGFRRVAQGGLHGCSVAARDILRAGLVEAASAIVLVHNHPSGDPTPSVEDIAMTRLVSDAADVVGVPLVDHVVIARDRHASLLELGLVS
ncbi:MAG: DNA repair protein RadC [Polyangiaceae bacterium]